MEYQEATTELIEAGVPLTDLADRIGCSVGLLRQARLDPSASSYRSPPEGWRGAAASLARERSERLASLADRLKSQSDK